ncbi:DUF2147 domain-containing protein [Lewinella sp. IMCC34183]|uniref:DUF2147 domain-containing protein n=1 Tax=Lewinella sp. IMCC34183 TaxID=2248762 RepID=UPI000E24ED98|nr:DUF2147 domain-containing protein [Lewinella sp. IMCC34183]
MKYLFFTLSFLLLSPLFAQLDSPVGRWKTIDDESGETQSVVEIYAKRGGYYGKIAQILSGNVTAVCELCEGNKKNKPILGLEIIEGLRANDSDDHAWEGGTILDPRKGSSYRLEVWYEDGNPDVLYVRGKHWTGLYRTQEWIRE